MPMIVRILLIALAACAALLLSPSPARAQVFNDCTVSATSDDLGSASSFAVEEQAYQASGSGGFQCTALSVATTSYIKVRLESTTQWLTGPTGQHLPFTVSATAGGATMSVGSEVDLSSFSLYSLFTGPSNSVPIYVSTTPTAGLSAGTYTGTVSLRWYFSVCTVGVLTCITTSQSPGFQRPILFTPLNWGTGVPVTITLNLTIEEDCRITAPDLDFGAAPLAGSFDPVTRTISIRCSAGASYSVGLSDGDHFSAGSRRMRSAAGDFLRYEIFKGLSGSNRWGVAGTERRGSETADINPGIHDGSTLQGFSYRGVVDAAQPTPPGGSYTDTIVLDVAF